MRAFEAFLDLGGNVVASANFPGAEPDAETVRLQFLRESVNDRVVFRARAQEDIVGEAAELMTNRD